MPVMDWWTSPPGTLPRGQTPDRAWRPSRRAPAPVQGLRLWRIRHNLAGAGRTRHALRAVGIAAGAALARPAGMEIPAPQLVEDAPLRCLLSVPERGPDAATPRPVLCFLHGYDEAAPMDIRRALTRHGPLRSGNPALARERFIVVAPQLPRGGDVWHRHADDVLRIVRDVERAHGGGPARRYLTGFSFGGNGVFDLALSQPGAWTALWAVDPTRVPRRDPGRPVWLSVGSVARTQQRAFVDALGLRPPDDTPGDRVILDQREDHVGSATRAYGDERIYRWLLEREGGGGSSQ